MRAASAGRRHLPSPASLRSAGRPRHDSNVRHPASKAGALSCLSYGDKDVAGKLLELEQRASWLHYGGRTDSTAGIRTRTSGSRGEGWLQLDGHGMSDGDRETVEADPVSRAPTCSLCPGCSRWTRPPTGFEPASSWRSNAPTRRSPRAVGKLTARRAMTPGDALQTDGTHRLVDHTLWEPTADASPVCVATSMVRRRASLSTASSRVLPRGIEPLCQLNLERKQPPDLQLRLFDDSSDKDRSRCPVCVPARDHHAL